MSKIKVNYSGDLRTQAIHLDSKHEITTDAPKDNNGLGRKFSPTDLIASALGSCLLTIMGIVAQRYEIDLENSYANIQKKMSENPRRISFISINIFFSKVVTDSQKKILQKAAMHCPVHNSLSNEIDIKINFN